MIAYTCGSFDILRIEDLRDLDREVQLSKEKGIKKFGIGVYTTDLCMNLGSNKPLKSLEDRMKIMEQIIGVDFVFPVSSLDRNLIRKTLEELNNENKLEIKEQKQDKKYELAYAPGTYDLFHAGHLENLLEAASQSEKLIVGIKSDELLQEHKGKSPEILDDERVEIMRHFKFVSDVYKYHTRDPHVANDWIKSKYGKGFDAMFLGSDLKNDFSKYKDLNIIFTQRDKETMKEKSSSIYAKRYQTLVLGKSDSPKYTGHISQKELKKGKNKEKPNEEHEL